MIVAGEPETSLSGEENVLNALLEPTAMSFRDDTANSLTEHWEDNLQSAPHAATASSNPGQGPLQPRSRGFDPRDVARRPAGRGTLGLGRSGYRSRPARGLALFAGRTPGRPRPGGPAERGPGNGGRAGRAACVSNEGIPFSYTFTGPLLASLAADHPAPLAWWRQLLGLAAAGAAIVLLFRRLARGSSVAAASHRPGSGHDRVPPTQQCSVRIAALGDQDRGPADHLRGWLAPGSHGKDPWGENGIGRFMHVLAANGYLPLVAPDLSPERLNRAAMLISIAPAQAFSRGEIAAVSEFVQQGGFFLSMVGSPDAGPSRTLLDEFRLPIQPAPLPPWFPGRRRKRWQGICIPTSNSRPCSSMPPGPSPAIPARIWPKDDPDGKMVIAGHGIGQRPGIHSRRYGLRLEEEPRLLPAERRLLARHAKKLARPAGRHDDHPPKPKG